VTADLVLTDLLSSTFEEKKRKKKGGEKKDQPPLLFSAPRPCFLSLSLLLWKEKKRRGKGEKKGCAPHIDRPNSLFAASTSFSQEKKKGEKRKRK